MIEDNIINKEANERTVLVGLATKIQTETKANEYLDELAFLARTAGAEPEKRFVQKLDYPNPRTYVGTGKLEEIYQEQHAHSKINQYHDNAEDVAHCLRSFVSIFAFHSSLF